MKYKVIQESAIIKNSAGQLEKTVNHWASLGWKLVKTNVVYTPKSLFEMQFYLFFEKVETSKLGIPAQSEINSSFDGDPTSQAEFKSAVNDWNFSPQELKLSPEKASAMWKKQIEIYSALNFDDVRVEAAFKEMKRLEALYKFLKNQAKKARL